MHKTTVFLAEMLFEIYVTDTVRFPNYDYIGQVLESQINLLKASTVEFEACKEV